jgi:hypothetical protein
VSQQINLFNPIFLRQEKHFSALAMVQGLAIISLVLGGLTAYSNYRLSQLRNDTVTMSKQLTNAQGQRQQLVERDKPKEKNKALEEEIRTLENRLDTRRKVLEFVQHGERGNTSGYSEYFRAFARQQVNGLWLTGFTLAGSEMQIDGRALQAELVPAYLIGIKQEALFQGKSFSTLQIQSPQGVGAANAGKSDSAAKRPAAAAYVEFSLRSSAAGNESPGEGKP